MVVHEEGLVGIELYYTAQLTVQPVRGFENGCHHFSAAESALPAVSEPSADIPSSPRYHYFCVNAHVASQTSPPPSLSAGDSIVVHTPWLYCMCTEAMLRPQEIRLNNYICNTITCIYLASRSAIISKQHTNKLVHRVRENHQ